jgi:hypothetical protein
MFDSYLFSPSNDVTSRMLKGEAAVTVYGARFTTLKHNYHVIDEESPDTHLGR